MNIILKQRTLGILFFLLLLSPEILFSQKIADNVYKQFSPQIIIKLYDNVVSKISLSEQSQMWIAKAYTRNDSLIADLIKKGNISISELKRVADSSQWAIEEDFKKILFPSEQKDFESKIVAKRDYPHPVVNNRILPDAEMNSQFGVALKMKNILKLRDAQSDSLLTYAALLKSKLDFASANPDSGYFDRPAYESENMSKILTEDQYTVMLSEKNKPQCQNQAKYIWHDLKVMGLSNKFDKEESLKNLTIYYLLRAHITERFANEKERQRAMIYALKIPEALKAWQQSKKTDKDKLGKYEW